MTLEQSVSEYTNTGQSEIFLATQENKLYNSELVKYPIYPDMLEEVRMSLKCEFSDL